MSDSDQEYNNSLHPGLLDLKSDLPPHSPVDFTLELGADPNRQNPN